MPGTRPGMTKDYGSAFKCLIGLPGAMAWAAATIAFVSMP